MFTPLRNLFLLVFIFYCTLTSQSQSRPKIGLTLSGGGAKGIAHIGILQAIDSAGLNIDAITGTSMGSIMGAMYAAGYSGNQMEEIVREMDWATLFSGKALYENVNMDEKSEFDQYAAEIPFTKGKLNIGTGVLEGQEIWLKFQELLLPVYDVKDFSKLSIPFKCIATDVGTGKAVVMDKGEIITAIRASMAIPSIFTAIDFNNTKLVDGGVVRNFPVRDVLAMGADYTIGVNLSQGLEKAENLTGAVDILYQIAFYKDADDLQSERKLCNILIEPKLEGYSAGSFSSTEELLKIGKETGKKYYPAFKKLADSLKALDPSYTFRKNRLPKHTRIIMDEYEVKGLKNTTLRAFSRRLNLKTGESYDGQEIATAIRKVYGSRNYNRIAYRWTPTTPGHARLVFDVIENPRTYLKLGLHFHSFSNVALITTLASKNLLLDRSKTLLKLNLSENLRILAQQNQSFGGHDNNNLIFSFYYENMRFPLYNDFEEAYLYRNKFTQFDLKIQHTFNQSGVLGVGSGFENFVLKPKVSGIVDVEAGNQYWHSYLYYNLTTINHKHFTTKGWQVYARLGAIYHQQPDDVLYEIGKETGIIDTLSFENYGQLRINVENFKPLSSKFSLQSQINTGMNLKDHQGYLNFFNVGGLTDFLRNQITFAGLNEFQVKANSIAVAGVGLQYNPFKDLYATVRANVGLYDFTYDIEEAFDSGNFLSGYALTLGYRSPLGPLQFSIMYNDQSAHFSGYANIGFHF